MPTTINTFRNVRIRLTRQSDGSLIAGWVIHLAREQARIRLWSDLPLSAGEHLRCECYGQGTVARFTGSVIAQAGEEIALRVMGTIAYDPSAETPRIYASGLDGQLKGPDGGFPMQVLDLSPVSLGVLVGAEIPSTGELTMAMSTEMGPISARVSIANSRPDAASPGSFRMGLHIVEMSRLDRARWGRLVLDRAAA